MDKYTNINNLQIKQLITEQRAFFSSKATYAIAFRIAQLEKLKQALISAIPNIKMALYEDLGRCDFEAGFDLGVIDEIDYFIANLPVWMEKHHVTASPMQQPAQVYIEPVPRGVCLIISPWNYPIELTIAPLLGAISGGNTAIIKTSEYSPNCSKVLMEVINNTFPRNYLHVVLGGAEIAQELLQNRFDHIFYTGSTSVGRQVYQEASKHLTPVVLELGGKSPCIIDKNIDYKQAARRILFAKLINSGQTCVAPDYCLIDEHGYDEFVVALQDVLLEFYPSGALKSNDYSKIISQNHLERLQTLILAQDKEHILCGGDIGLLQQKISPCLISLGDISHLTSDANLLNNPLLQEEIFGPILPILKYKSLSEAFAMVQKNSHPLALYIFTNDENFSAEVMNNISSGGTCVNDIMVHLFNNRCGFGGVGSSGIGAYHGELSFKVYSHYRTVAMRELKAEDPLNVRFPPYYRKSQN